MRSIAFHITGQCRRLSASKCRCNSSAVSLSTVLWSSFFVTLRAKNPIMTMPLFQMASCCFSCFKGGFIVIVRMRSSMIVRCVSKFFYCCIQSFFCLVFMLIDQFIFNVLKYLSIGALSYGYPALLILCVTAIRLQYSVKSLEVYWLP